MSFQLFCGDHLEPLPEHGKVGGDPSGRPALPTTARSVAPVRKGGRTGSLLPPALFLRVLGLMGTRFLRARRSPHPLAEMMEA